MNYDPLKKPPFNEQPDYSHPFVPECGWWMFNERAGGIAHDLSPGRLNPGTLVGPTWQGGALYFPGVSEYVSASHINSVTANGTYTFSAWVYIDLSASANGTIFANASGSSDRNAMSWDASEVICFGVYAGVDWVAKSGPISKGVWTHVAGVNDGGSLNLYIDGIPQTGTTTTYSYQTHILYFGRTGYSGSERWLYGLISDARFHNRALSAAQVNALRDNSLSGEYKEFPRPVVYFLPPVAGAIAPTSVLYGPLVGPLSGPI